MHSKKSIEMWSERLPNLSRAMFLDNIDEAKKLLLEYPDCESFCIENWRLTDQEGGDNSLDLSAYWHECYNFLKEHCPDFVPA